METSPSQKNQTIVTEILFRATTSCLDFSKGTVMLTPETGVGSWGENMIKARARVEH